jgi:hypothetical protein
VYQFWWGDICKLDSRVSEVSNSYSVKEVYRKLLEGSISLSNQSWSKAWHKSIRTIKSIVSSAGIVSKYW